MLRNKVKYIEKRCLSIKELAQYLGVSRPFIQKKYPAWAVDYGIRIYRLNSFDAKRARIVFEKKDIDERLLPRFLVNPGGNNL